MCGFYPPDLVGRLDSLTDGQKRLYERLVRYAGQDGLCYPKQEKLARELGKSERQVRYDLKKLCALNFISVRLRSGKRRVNIYDFLWHPVFDGHPIAGRQEPKLNLTGNPLPIPPAARAEDCLSQPARLDSLSGNRLPTNSVQEIHSGEKSNLRHQSGRLETNGTRMTPERRRRDRVALRVPQPQLAR